MILSFFFYVLNSWTKVEQNLRVTESYNQTMIFYKEIKTKTLYFRKKCFKIFF